MAPTDAVTISFEGEPLPALAGEPVAVALYAAGVRTLGAFVEVPPAARAVLPRRSLRLLLPAHRRTPQPAGLRDAGARRAALRAAERLPERRRRSPGRRRLAVPDRDGPPHDDDRQPRRQRDVPEGGARDGRLGHAPDDARRDARRPPRPSKTWSSTSASSAGGRPAWRPPAPSPRRRRARGSCCYDEQATPGGSLLAEPGGTAQARALADAARAAGVRLIASATAIAYYPEDRRRATVTPRAARRRDAERPRAGACPPDALRHRQLRSEPALRRQRSSGGDRRARAADGWRSTGGCDRCRRATGS